ncbi:hypothetical protein [Pedobacter aquatilis]|uniref:hypothetical protein n=1 Tax=Pedobacter aquatilis TaxID=351343 RepID=UPI0029313DB1|nr:hypothetical protein [Pedobacter aquatilis]
MKHVINILSGLAGALSLNVLHESLKHLQTDMPRVDLVGKEALNKLTGKLGFQIESEANQYRATLAADLISNALYYSMIGLGGKKYLWPRAIALGLSAGIGAVRLPEPLGLDQKPVNKNLKTSGLTIAYYLSGALVTGLALAAMRKK